MPVVPRPRLWFDTTGPSTVQQLRAVARYAEPPAVGSVKSGWRFWLAVAILAPVAVWLFVADLFRKRWAA